jgi:cytochrome oxidase assembly protein ShyY1
VGSKAVVLLLIVALHIAVFAFGVWLRRRRQRRRAMMRDARRLR